MLIMCGRFVRRQNRWPTLIMSDDDVQDPSIPIVSLGRALRAGFVNDPDMYDGMDPATALYEYNLELFYRIGIPMTLCPDSALNGMVLQRIGIVRELESIVIRNKKKQPRRVARRKRLRRALRAADRAIAERCHEIFTP